MLSRQANKSVWYLQRSTRMRSNFPSMGYTSGTLVLFSLVSSASVVAVVISVRLSRAITAPAIIMSAMAMIAVFIPNLLPRVLMELMYVLISERLPSALECSKLAAQQPAPPPRNACL